MYGNNYYIDGFLYKEVQTESMCEWNNVKPTLDELKQFQDNNQNEG
jgi:transcription elongation factor